MEIGELFLLLAPIILSYDFLQLYKQKHSDERKSNDYAIIGACGSSEIYWMLRGILQELSARVFTHKTINH